MKSARDLLQILQLHAKQHTPNIYEGCLDTSTKIVCSVKAPLPEKVDTACEKVLQQLTNSFVATFPMRSFEPLQWNKSNHINMNERKANYSLEDDRAELLNTLVDSKDVDRDEERRIFSTLTSPLKYNFSKPDNSKTVVVECNEKKQKLLKTSEGIIEAEQFALILAHNRYHTVCFEEPDTGMHPQMIEKMRDLVLKTYKLYTYNFSSPIDDCKLDFRKNSYL